MGYEYIVYYFSRENIYHEKVGVYAKAVAPTLASYTYYSGETLGL